MTSPADGPEDVPDAVLERLRAICAELPEAYEEPAWTGTRWRIRTKTLAHVLVVDADGPPAHARALGTIGVTEPRVVLTFRAAGADLEVLGQAGPPFFNPIWFEDIVGMVLDDRTDWAEVAELVTDSYCLLAPKKLAARVVRPGPLPG